MRKISFSGEKSNSEILHCIQKKAMVKFTMDIRLVQRRVVFLDLGGLKTICKIAVSGFLVIGLNQNLLLCLTAFQQKEKAPSAAVSCACPPTTCMCPPSNGCEHRSRGNSEIRSKEQITLCRPNPFDREADNRFSKDWDMPILTLHSNRLALELSFTYLNRSPANLLSQQYLTPPDKPPQRFSA